MKTECAICESDREVSEMTDGQFHIELCGACRELLVPLFYLYGSLEHGVKMVKLARVGSETIH